MQLSEMKMKRVITIIACCIFMASGISFAKTNAQDPVKLNDALATARDHLSKYTGSQVIISDLCYLISRNDDPVALSVAEKAVTDASPEPGALAWVFKLEPSGYVVVSASSVLPEIPAWSFTGDFGRPEAGNPLYSLLKSDLTVRLDYALERGKRWAGRAGEHHIDKSGDRPEQWPAGGDGWLATNWTQNAPYNNLCPMDPLTSTRSYAGCPAVAMAQILNFHKNTNNTHFSDNDDYYHSYAGRNYWIDDDYAQNGFPSFDQLNVYLDTLNAHYNRNESLSGTDKAALVFACGVACTQVFTSQASGTFGVNQAFDAYQRFGFSTAVLLDETSADLYDRLKQNMMDTLPAHLAVVDPSWQTGHNVVVDGYNSDDYYHLNFGWGGMYNGWYLLPEEIPYNLTVVEGVVLDISKDTTTVSSHHLLAGQALAFPNPSAGRLTIAFPDAPGQVFWVRIFNPAGCLMESREGIRGSSIAMDLSDRPGGLYLYTIGDRQGRTTTGKFMINR